MRWVWWPRLAIGAAGAGLAGYGGWLLLGQLRWNRDWLLNLSAFLFTGPILHDLLVAPVVALVGVALSRLVPPSWRPTVGAGLAATAILALIAVPLIWRPHPAPPNPGLQERAYLPGLAVLVAALWLVLIGVHLLRVARRRWYR